MRKRRYLNFIGILNKFLAGDVDKDAEKVFRLRFIWNSYQTIPAEGVLIYSENAQIASTSNQCLQL